MGSDILIAAAFLGVFAALFLTLGIVPLVCYFRLKRGENAVAEVTEHLLEDTRTDRGQRHYTWMMKMKYSVGGVEYENRYKVIKERAYIESHPVGTAIKILVDPKKPKLFIIPEDMKKPLIPGIFFTVGGLASLAGVIALMMQYTAAH